MNDARDSKSPFGILDFLVWDDDWNRHHYSFPKVEKAVPLMKEAGVGFIRMDFLWEDIEPKKGEFSFDKYDRLVDLLDKNDIKILGLLHYNVSWNSAHWFDPPDPDLFANYARRVVARYKSRVKYWELWNEPNVDIYWKPQDGMKRYTALLKRTYTELKREDATCRLLVGGLSMDFIASLEQLYQQGAKDYFDICNVHPFVTPVVENALALLIGSISKVRAVMAAHGDAVKPLWITELGCPGMPAGAQTKEWWLGRNSTEDEQARWVEKVYDGLANGREVEKIFWAFFRDTPNHFECGTDFFGLLREDFSKKPAFFAYQKRSLNFLKIGIRS